MKKMIVLSPEEKNLNNGKILEFMKFAKEHRLRPMGETHYPPILPIEMPEVFVEVLKDRIEDCVYVIDDPCLIFANAYNDGKLAKLLEEANIKILHKELKCDLKKIFEDMNKEQTQYLKNAVTSTINELKNKIELECEKIAVFYQNENDEEVKEFIECLSRNRDVSICGICIPEYNECMKESIQKILKSNNVHEVIIYDEKMRNQDLIDCFEELDLKYRYKESEINMSISGLYFN